ncbi:MAG: hypothetical protein EOO74_03930 [Myxococcales bacterium]|nr:MAG: hypothetical protein EOO74_03930 [Myxococcales bacterium]
MRRKALREKHRAIRTLQHWTRRLKQDQDWNFWHGPPGRAAGSAYQMMIIPPPPKTPAFPTKGPWKGLARRTR